VSLDILADLDLPCPSCEGQRYRPEVLAVRWPGTDDHVAAFLARPVDPLLAPLDADGTAPARALAEAARRLGTLGLGGLSLGRALATLSGGELQRVVLAAFDPSAPPTQLRLLQPDRGLHDADLVPVAAHLRRLGAAGHLVVVAGARPSLRAAVEAR
jgi:excinuclease ABC subunit A